MSSGLGMPVVAGSLADQAYLALRDMFVTLAIRPGAPVNEEEVCAGLGIGRTPVREALKRLETDRLVVAFSRRGTFATEVHISDLNHISEVRRELEPVAAALAAKRATRSDRERLDRLQQELADDGHADGRALIKLDMQVHRSIYAATHNPYLETTLSQYDNLATRIWCLFLDRLPNLGGHVAEHVPLLRAVVDADVRTARKLAAEHVARFESAVRQLI